MKHMSRIIVISLLAGLIACCFFANAMALKFMSITPEALKALMDKGDENILIVDTQPRAVYEQGHIKGAVNLPWAAEISSPGDLTYDKLLILYCDCSSEEDSLDVADQLQKWDYVRIKVLKGGWSQWKKLGYPIEKGGQ